MKSLLLSNRKKINRDLSFGKRKYFSPATLIDAEITPKIIKQYAKGKCIDIGCGDSPLRYFIKNQTDCYHTLDIENRMQEPLTYTSDVCNMKDVKGNSYDFAICLQVLEHVNDPFAGMKEINRILSKKGILVLSVPHLSRLHEEPHDYFRYTKYGLKYLAESSGFKILSITANGGLFCFLGHQLSTLILVPIWHIPIIKNIFFFLNKWFISRFFCFIDKKIDKRKIFALGYTCVFEKKLNPRANA